MLAVETYHFSWNPAPPLLVDQMHLMFEEENLSSSSKSFLQETSQRMGWRWMLMFFRKFPTFKLYPAFIFCIISYFLKVFSTNTLVTKTVKSWAVKFVTDTQFPVPSGLCARVQANYEAKSSSDHIRLLQSLMRMLPHLFHSLLFTEEGTHSDLSCLTICGEQGFVSPF